MRNTVLAALALLAAASAPGPALAAEPSAPAVPRQLQQWSEQGPGVRIWTEDERDLFRSGDRTRVLVRTSRDAFLAVVHVDTNGNVEFLFPSSAYEDGYVRGGRLLSVPVSGSSRYWSVRGSPGIGYLMAVASDEPLDLRGFRGFFRRASSWDAERVIWGDPFQGMERIARALAPGWDEGTATSDYFSYHVGSRYSYPRYACYDGYGAWYYGRASTYDSCDRVRILLRDVPHYYDTRHYRGDRRRYYAGYVAPPQHRYKEAPGYGESRGRGVYGGRAAPPPVERSGDRSRSTDRARSAPGRDETAAPAQAPSRQRPTLERRPESTPPRARPRSDPPPARERPRAEPRREAPRREAPRPAEPRSGGSEGSGARVRPSEG